MSAKKPALSEEEVDRTYGEATMSKLGKGLAALFKSLVSEGLMREEALVLTNTYLSAGLTSSIAADVFKVSREGDDE